MRDYFAGRAAVYESSALVQVTENRDSVKKHLKIGDLFKENTSTSESFCEGNTDSPTGTLGGPMGPHAGSSVKCTGTGD